MAPLTLDEQAANIARQAHDIEQESPRGSAVSELAHHVRMLAEIVAVLAITKDDK